MTIVVDKNGGRGASGPRERSILRAAGTTAFERHVNPIDPEPFGSLRAAANRPIGARADVEQSTAAAAVSMIVALGARFIADCAPSFGDAPCDADVDERIESLVDGLLTDVGMASDQAPVYLERRRVAAVGSQQGEHGHALAGRP